MNRKIHFIVTAVVSIALLTGHSQPKEAVPQNMNSQKEGNGKSTSKVQNITSSEVSMTRQPGKGAVIYMTADINSDSLMEIYQALGAAPASKVVVKLSTGEPESSYLHTDPIGGLVQSLQAAVVECNTIHGGARSNTAMHYQIAKDHGYTTITDIDIMDEGGSMTFPVTGGTNLTENCMGEHFLDYDYYVILLHFKDHAMTEFGGAIKSISIGLASAEGENHVHATKKNGSMWSTSRDPFLEPMTEAEKPAAGALNGNVLYINVMNHLNVDCDCNTGPAEPDMYDVGILTSYDPAALNQTYVNLVYAAADGQSLVNRIESRNDIHALGQTEKIGLGSGTYTLVNLDE